MNRNQWMLGVVMMGATGFLLTATPRVEAQTFVSVRAIAVPFSLIEAWTNAEFGKAAFTGAVNGAVAGAAVGAFAASGPGVAAGAATGTAAGTVAGAASYAAGQAYDYFSNADSSSSTADSSSSTADSSSSTADSSSSSSTADSSSSSSTADSTSSSDSSSSESTSDSGSASSDSGSDSNSGDSGPGEESDEGLPPDFRIHDFFGSGESVRSQQSLGMQGFDQWGELGGFNGIVNIFPPALEGIRGARFWSVGSLTRFGGGGFIRPTLLAPSLLDTRLQVGLAFVNGVPDRNILLD